MPSFEMEKDEHYFMGQAYALAQQAYAEQEVPVGAVVVLEGEIIGRGYNSVRKTSDPSAHAEILALREAGKHVGNYRILESDLYVTLEPCLMCYSAMVHARVRTMVYGAPDAKTGVFATGAFDEIKNVYNHTIAVKCGIMSEASSKILQDFFKERRGAGAVERGGLESR